MNVWSIFVASDWTYNYMCFSKPKVKIYHKHFLESGFQYSLEYSSKYLLQVSDKNVRGKLEKKQLIFTWRLFIVE